ncbi:hypothetical protein AB0I81_13660 [Nonomuraea sp. NPDC050404]|uniref:hypothetical protein n=1 Tax=Nonomuraea sp. NPDC050404 TaxID=3155783 RepID=UPI00340BBED3
MPNEPAMERRSRRGTALRIAALLVGVLSLALAAVLIGLPNNFRTLDPLPVPDRDGERSRGPVAALSALPTAAPIDSPAGPSPAKAPATTTPPTATPPTTASRTTAGAATPSPTPSATPGTARGARAVPPAEGHAAPREVTKILPGRPRRSGKAVLRPTRTATATPGRVRPALPKWARLPNSIKGRGPAK